MRAINLTWPHRLLLIVAALIMAMVAVALIKAGGAVICKPVLVIDRPAGSLKVYPGGGGDQETLTLRLCPDGSVRGELTRYRNERQEVKR